MFRFARWLFSQYNNAPHNRALIGIGYLYQVSRHWAAPVNAISRRQRVPLAAGGGPYSNGARGND
jgi:hypothetical protein